MKYIFLLMYVSLQTPLRENVELTERLQILQEFGDIPFRYDFDAKFRITLFCVSNSLGLPLCHGK